MLQKRAHPSPQLSDHERLGQVVGGSKIEPGDDVLLRNSGSEHEDRALRAQLARGAEFPKNLESAEAGHHDIKEDKVGVELAVQREPLVAIGGEVHVVVLDGERVANQAPQVRVVIDHEYPRSHAQVFAERSP